MDPTFRELAVATHLIGAMLWIGGTVAAAVVAIAGARETGDTQKAVLTAARRAALYVAAPGLLIAFVAGLAYLVPNFTTIYARAGWMHGKLTLVLIAAAMTGVFTGRLRRAAAGTKPASVGLFAAAALVSVLVAAAVSFLAELQPGGTP
jgi:uncharacterized membrane protein